MYYSTYIRYLEQVGGKPLNGVGGSFLHETGHAIEEERDHCLVEIGANRESLQVELVIHLLHVLLRRLHL